MGLISAAPAGMTNEPFPNISIPAPSPVQEGPRLRRGAAAIANAIGCGGKQSCLCSLGCCRRWLMGPLAPVRALGGGAVALRHRAWQKQRTPGLTEKGCWPVLCLLQARPEVVSLIQVSQIYSWGRAARRWCRRCASGCHMERSFLTLELNRPLHTFYLSLHPLLR